jgi:1-aminocyclopropane-1-carboxylate deaminase/D-cysteine desulfhydrase-like pyridoxal-dependent ACC family enzyme
MKFSPIEKINNIFIKREDLAIFNNINGGKGRVIQRFINQGIEQGYTDFVTCGSRDSVQCEMVSFICEEKNVKCHLFMPNGKDTPILLSIAKNSNTEVIRTKVGYTNVLKKWSSDYAKEHNYFYIPFALECTETIEINQEQVQNIPDEVKRIVVPIGSGMNFISIIKGLEKYKKDIPVLGIQIGLDPTKNIQKFLGTTTIEYSIIKSELPYAKKPTNCNISNITVNPTYEAKCLPYLQDNDLFWVIGKELN